MTLQIYSSKLCSYCNDVLNTVGDKGKGLDRTCCDRDHSHKHYLFKTRIELLIKQFDLIENKYEQAKEAGLVELSKSTFEFVHVALEWIDIGLRTDILSTNLHLIFANKGSFNITWMKSKIDERKLILRGTNTKVEETRMTKIPNKSETFELLYNKLMKPLVEPKTLDELAKIFPKENIKTIYKELARLRKNNFVVKIGSKYKLHPVYLRQNSI